MTKYILSRVIRAVITLVLLVSFIFIAMHYAPGDPVTTMLGAGAGPEKIRAMRHKYGLDKPLAYQYIDLWRRLIRADFGISWKTGTNVSQRLFRSVKYTLMLASTAMVIATAIGVLAGIVSATKRDRLFDATTRSITLVGISLPTFVLGLSLMYIFAYVMDWFPSSGATSLKSLVLPAITLSLWVAGSITRLVRSAMLDVLNQDYITGARAKGFSERFIIYKIALKNAGVTILTVLGLQFGLLLGGSVITEIVFSWPGLGQLMVEGVKSRDTPVVQGCVLFFAGGFIVVNLLVDFVYSYIDPRIRYQ